MVFCSLRNRNGVMYIPPSKEELDQKLLPAEKVVDNELPNIKFQSIFILHQIQTISQQVHIEAGVSLDDEVS